jgi:hypothetical protein
MEYLPCALTLYNADGKIPPLLPPSSSGLGRGPLKAETGVRTPVGAHEPPDPLVGRYVIKSTVHPP